MRCPLLAYPGLCPLVCSTPAILSGMHQFLISSTRTNTPRPPRVLTAEAQENPRQESWPELMSES